MTAEDVIRLIREPLTAWHLNLLMPATISQISQDTEANQEGASECFRSVYDTLREFEAECVQRGKEEAASKIATQLVKCGSVNYDKTEEFTALLSH